MVAGALFWVMVQEGGDVFRTISGCGSRAKDEAGRRLNNNTPRMLLVLGEARSSEARLTSKQGGGTGGGALHVGGEPRRVWIVVVVVATGRRLQAQTLKVDSTHYRTRRRRFFPVIGIVLSQGRPQERLSNGGFRCDRIGTAASGSDLGCRVLVVVIECWVRRDGVRPSLPPPVAAHGP